MRTISSFRFVGVLEPPTKLPTPLPMPEFGFGKKPVPSNAVAFGWIMQDGMTLPGNGAPRTMPGGGAPPGQLANRTESATLAAVGTRGISAALVTELKSPP